MTDREQFDSDFEGDFDTDDELRTLLRNSDPAHSLPPANAATLAHLLEDIMSTDLDVRPGSSETGNRTTGTHGRNRLAWLVAAAAAVVIAGAGGFAISSLGGSGATPSAGPSPSSGPDAGSGSGDQALAPVAGLTTELGAASASGRCGAVDSDLIAAQEQAFQGTVTAIDGDTVTLSTSDVFAGEVGETVVVKAPSPELRSLILATKFKVGGSYLVSASGGTVAVCGLTGKAGGQLTTLYNEAFTK